MDFSCHDTSCDFEIGEDEHAKWELMELPWVEQQFRVSLWLVGPTSTAPHPESNEDALNAISAPVILTFTNQL